MWNPFSRRPPAVVDPPLIEEKVRLAAVDTVFSSGPLVDTSIAQVQRIGNVAVATFTVVEISQPHGVALLMDLLNEMTDSGATHFVLDTQNVQFMDSACLGCLVEALNRIARNGGRIALANAAASVQYLFRLTQLDRVFPVCGDVMSALATVERQPR